MGDRATAAAAVAGMTYLGQRVHARNVRDLGRTAEGVHGAQAEHGGSRVGLLPVARVVGTGADLRKGGGCTATLHIVTRAPHLELRAVNLLPDLLVVGVDAEAACEQRGLVRAQGARRGTPRAVPSGPTRDEKTAPGSRRTKPPVLCSFSSPDCAGGTESNTRGRTDAALTEASGWSATAGTDCSVGVRCTASGTTRQLALSLARVARPATSHVMPLAARVLRRAMNSADAPAAKGAAAAAAHPVFPPLRHGTPRAAPFRACVLRRHPESVVHDERDALRAQGVSLALGHRWVRGRRTRTTELTHSSSCFQSCVDTTTLANTSSSRSARHV
jgi:hypothetical protein